MLRERTVTPNTSPITSVTWKPGRSFIVETIMLSSLTRGPAMSMPGALHVGDRRAGAWCRATPARSRGDGWFGRANDRGVHTVRDLVRRADVNIDEASIREAVVVLGDGQSTGDAADIFAPKNAVRGVRWSSATMSVTPRRPPGLRTRNASANTAGLLVDRLMT